MQNKMLLTELQELKTFQREMRPTFLPKENLSQSEMQPKGIYLSCFILSGTKARHNVVLFFSVCSGTERIYLERLVCRGVQKAQSEA